MGGEHRVKPARDPAPWSGVRDALDFGATAAHGYFTQAPELPEAIAAWRETIHHFDRYLGK